MSQRRPFPSLAFALLASCGGAATDLLDHGTGTDDAAVQAGKDSGGSADLSAGDLAGVTDAAIPSGFAIVKPGPGWTGPTTVTPATVGSTSKVGGAFSPTVRFEAPEFIELSSPYVLWIHAYHTGEKSDYLADGHPTFGIDKVSVAADGGTFVDVKPTFNTAGNYWGFPVAIDPADWPDGIADAGDTGHRTLRIVAWPRNGSPKILQDDAGTIDQAFRFATNANGTLSHPVRYLAANGSDANSGLDAAHPQLTTEGALASIGNEVGGAELVYGAGSWDIGASTTRTATNRYLTMRAADGLSADEVVFDKSSSYHGTQVPLVHVKGVTQRLVYPGTGNGSPTPTHLWLDEVVSDRGAEYLRVADPVGLPWALSGSNNWNLTYITGGSITNYANGLLGVQTVIGTHVGTIASDLFTNARLAVNVTCDKITAGPSLDKPESQGGTVGPNFHPDMAQYYGQINVAGKGWFAGGILVNTTVTSGDAQGPFFKDSNYVRGIFIVNASWTMHNTTRNSFVIADNNYSPPAFPYTILQNSMFWDSTFYPGNGSRGGGHSEDVIWKNVKVNGDLPSGAVAY